jgi:diaminohydroxyphosphoribosylaminopyrimidine deaminase/5-amino-6-(5-phosphoribosylamino)uracil reductase
VHRWRSEEQGIFAGTQTILTDNPMLTNRYWTGKQPVRMTIDRSLRIPNDFHIFNADAPTVIFNDVKDEIVAHLQYVKMEEREDLYENIRKFAYKHQMQSIIVEGGQKILEYFLQQYQWDEIRRINANEVYAFEGIKAPECKGVTSAETFTIANDSIEISYR